MTEIEDRSRAASPDLERIPRGTVPIYDENGAIGRLMQTTFVTSPPFWTAGHAIDVMRAAGEEESRFGFYPARFAAAALPVCRGAAWLFSRSSHRIALDGSPRTVPPPGGTTAPG